MRNGIVWIASAALAVGVAGFAGCDDRPNTGTGTGTGSTERNTGTGSGTDRTMTPGGTGTEMRTPATRPATRPTTMQDPTMDRMPGNPLPPAGGGEGNPTP